jgi:Beta-lactamase superfamily domain
MKVTLLGHASVLVELAGATCLMDPVFGDPFEEGAVTSCPKRTIRPEHLPAIDILIVSHRHPDHFDIPSLARLPRGCDAICPADPLIVYALKQLGFERIHPVHPMAPISSEHFQLYPTKSEVRSVREFGVVFADPSGVFWNQVDSFLSAETIAAVADRFGRVALLFAMYASQTFDFLEDRSTRFPFEIHVQNLQAVQKIRPRMAVPGSAGFRFHGPAAALNPFLFPISRDRFVADLKELDTGIETEIANPGDVFVIDGEGVERRPAASDVAAMVEDDSHLIRFDPTQPVPDLGDPNTGGYSLDVLSEACDRIITQELLGYVCHGHATEDRVLQAYREHRTRYAIEIVFPQSPAAHYCIEFSEHEPRLITGMPAAEPADMVHRIAASALLDWVEHRKSYFYVRTYSRRHSILYRLDQQLADVNIVPYELPDLLMHYVLNAAEGSALAAKSLVDHQLRGIGVLP